MRCIPKGDGLKRPAALLLAIVAASPAAAQVGECDGIRVEVVCCAPNGEYRFTTRCVYVADWTQYWNACSVQALPSCPPGQYAYAFVLGVDCVGCAWNEAAWVRPLSLGSPTQPNCHFGCIQRCWDIECYFWDCDPWVVDCEQWYNPPPP
jgi:hypothetical protein